MNLYGKMDEWFGKTVTISMVGNGFYRIEEDYKDWLWTDDMIEGKVEDDTKEENHSSDYYLFKYLSIKLSEGEFLPYI